jgi:hypothetical protein
MQDAFGSSRRAEVCWHGPIFTPAVLAIGSLASMQVIGTPAIDSTGFIPPYPNARFSHGYTATSPLRGEG